MLSDKTREDWVFLAQGKKITPPCERDEKKQKVDS